MPQMQEQLWLLRSKMREVLEKKRKASPVKKNEEESKMSMDDSKREHDMDMMILKMMVKSGFLSEEQQIEGKILIASDELHSRVATLCDIIKLHDGDEDLVDTKREVLEYIRLVTGGIDMFISEHTEYAQAKQQAAHENYKVWCETQDDLKAVLKKADSSGYRWNSRIGALDLIDNVFFKAPRAIFFQGKNLLHGAKDDYDKCRYEELTVEELLEMEF